MATYKRFQVWFWGTSGSRHGISIAPFCSGLPASHIRVSLQDMMEDPVLADDGWTYERQSIQRWLDMGKRRSPMTNELLASDRLTSNRSIKSGIAEWRQTHRP